MKTLLYALMTVILAFSVCIPMASSAAEEVETATVATSEGVSSINLTQEDDDGGSVTDDSDDVTESSATEESVVQEPSSQQEDEDITDSSDTTTALSETTTEEPEETTTEEPEETTTEEPDETTTTEPEPEEEIEDVVSLDGKTILIAGNSMVYYGNCVIRGDAGNSDYGYFYQLIASHSEEATVIDHTYAGKKLSYIYENYLLKMTAEELNAVDYVVLSEAYQENDDLLGTCQQIMALFPETTQFRFMCHPMMYDGNMESLITGVETLRANNMEVVDWGKMVYDIYTGNVEVTDAKYTYDRCTFIKDNVGYKNGKGSLSAGADGDRKHPNPLSGYIAAQMLYTSITNRSAVLTDYSFCYDTSIHNLFNIDAFAQAHYTGTLKTNFNYIFQSPEDMLGLQKLIDLYVAAEGRHPLTVLEAVEPTCTRGGFTHGSYCAVCGEVVQQQEYIQSKGGHKLVYDKYVEATCTTAGRTGGIHCSQCDEPIVETRVIEAKGHTEEKVITKATESSDGVINTVCTVCNKTTSSVKINKISSIKLADDYFEYNGKAKKPAVTVTDSAGNVLKKGTDYSLSYSSGRKNVGNYTVTVAFKNNYSGSKVLTFKIRPGVTDTVTSKSYQKAVKLSWTAVNGATGYRVSVYDSATKKYKKLKDTDKTSYKLKNLAQGKKYKFRITAYTKSGTVTYLAGEYRAYAAVTKPSAVTLNGVSSSASKTAVVTWSRVKGSNGYQVVYSDSSSFKGAKSVIVAKQKKEQTTIKNLTSGKTCYFKVRAYKSINGSKVYGAYSSVKSVRVKY